MLDKGNLSSAGECFKFFASLNLINAYIKKDYAVKEFKDNYTFKKKIIDAIYALMENCPDGVSYGACNESVTYLIVYGLQFSFHCVMPKKSNIVLPIIEWKKLRLQPFAQYIFLKAINFK